MTDLFGLFFLTVAVAGGLGTIAIWSPRAIGAKLLATLVFFSFVPLSYAALVELTSRPKRVSLEWWGRGETEATVIANVMVEGQAIYLWLERAGSRMPRAYELPWSRELAEQLQSAAREAEGRGTGLGMRMPFEPSTDDDEPLFYPMPQEALPEKDPANNPQAMRYERAAAAQ